MSDTIRINVGPPTRDFIGEIADALACWDHAGMPSIGELSEEMQAAYRELAEKILKHEDRLDLVRSVPGELIDPADLDYKAAKRAVIAMDEKIAQAKYEGRRVSLTEANDLKVRAAVDAALGVGEPAEGSK